MSDEKKWKHPGPPPPLFAGKREKDFVKQVNDEVIERVIGQTIVYYPISVKYTNYHNLYGEAIEKTFHDPIKVHALVEYQNEQTSATPLGIDRVERINVSFHKRRLSEDQDLFVKEGDFVLFGETYYEILSITEPKWLFGQVDSKFEIIATCLQARGGLFDGR